METFVRSVKQNIEQLGVLRAVLYGASKLLTKVSRGRSALIVYDIVAQPLAAFAAPADGRPSPFVLTPCQPRDGIIAQFPTDRVPGIFELRFKQGHRCHVLTKADAFVGFIWLASGHYAEDTLRADYQFDAARAVWDFDLHIEPQYRLSRAYATLWQQLAQGLQNDGINWSLSRISAFNPRSLKSQYRAGARRLGGVTVCRIGNLELMMCSYRPRFNITWNARQCPVLKVPVPDA